MKDNHGRLTTQRVTSRDQPSWCQVMIGLAVDRSGVILVMFALLLPVLIGFLGLGIEVTFWYQNRRNLQTVADAAAIAGAYDIYSGGTATTAATAAATDATRNGYSVSTDTLTVNAPPTSGSYTADTKAVETVMTRQVVPLFASYFLTSNVTINVRAVATTPDSADKACVLALDTSGTGVAVSGNGTVAFDGCQVASNSTDTSALSVSGSGTLETDCYSVVGGVSSTSGLTVDSGCKPKTGALPIQDPYASLIAPIEACDNTGITHNDDSPLNISGTGSYTDAFVICGDLWVKKGTVTLSPGLYVIDGGDLKTNATGNLVGDGVTIVLRNGGQIDNLNGSSTVTLSAPTPSNSAGDWEGVLFYQDRETTSACTGNNCNTLNGNSSATFQGVVYFPNQEINISGGNEGTSKCLQVVALRVGFSGSGNVNANNSGCEAAGVDSILLPGSVALVE